MKLFSFKIIAVPTEPEISCQVLNFERLECSWEPYQTIYELLLVTTTMASWAARKR